LFGPSQQGYRILAAVSAAAAKRRFFMNANAPQENRLAIEQNLGALGFDSAETDLVLDTIGFGLDRNVIELGVAGRPKRQTGFETYPRKSIRVRGERFADSRFRNSNGYFLCRLIAVK